MAEKTIANIYPKTIIKGAHSAIIGDDIVNDIPDETVYVSEESELANYANKPVGTFAATYGLSAIWQKKPDGTWATVVEASGD